MMEGDRQKALEDLRIENAVAMKEGGEAANDLAELLNEKFKKAFKKHIEDPKTEVETLREAYRNKTVTDFWMVAKDEEEKEKYLYRSGATNSFVNKFAAQLTDTRPKIFLNPRFKPDFAEYFEKNVLPGLPQDCIEDIASRGGDVNAYKEWVNLLCDRLHDEWWVRSKIREKLKNGVVVAALSPIGWFKVRIDRGRIILAPCDYHTVCWDADAKVWEDCTCIFHVIEQTPRQVERKYGLKKDSVTGLENLDRKDEETGEITKHVRLVEAYLRDDSQGRRFIGMSDTGDELYEDFPLYPNGRIITFITGQDVSTAGGTKFLDDQAWELSVLPLIPLNLCPDGCETEGIPMARGIVPYETNIDRVMQLVMENHRLAGGDSIVYSIGAIDPDKLTNIIGRKIEVNENTPVNQAIQYVKADPSIEPGILLTNALMNGIRELTGIYEATEGSLSRRDLSGKALDNLRESGSVRNRPCVRAEESTLGDVVQVEMELMLYYLAVPGYRVCYGENFGTEFVLTFALSDIVAGFDTYIGEDTSIPRDKAFQTGIVMEIAKNPAITMASLKLICETLDIENKEEIYKVFEDERAYQQQLLQAQQQGEEMKKAILEMDKDIQAKDETINDLKLRSYAEVSKSEVALLVEKSRSERDEKRMVTDGLIQDSIEQTKKILGALNAQVEMLRISQAGGKSQEKVPA